ncbi:hypothetical protein THS27_07575 [Thalassospira sp. MCCC 1A01428]|nr:hypothetical protein THS27_07575 [Thalassospira sp. MCCC 1A01428]
MGYAKTDPENHNRARQCDLFHSDGRFFWFWKLAEMPITKWLFLRVFRENVSLGFVFIVELIFNHRF